MAIDVQWGDYNKTILIYHAQGAWTWNELYTATEQAHHMLDTVNHVVDSIIDLSEANAMPSGSLWHARRMAALRHVNSGRAVYVGGHNFLKAIFDVLQRLYKGHNPLFMYTDTVDKAFLQLKRQEPA